METIRTFQSALLGLAALGYGLAGGYGATVSVTDSVASFSTLQAMGGGILSDPTYDQQTGQGADDFVGDGTNGYYGFYYNFGQIGGVDSMVFRVRLNQYTTQQGAPRFTGNIRIGVDGDGDGNVDLYFGVSTGQGQNPQIVFQNPTGTAADANTSPSTSALGTAYGAIANTASNYNYSQVTDGSAYHTNKPSQPNTDAFLTFAIPFSTFKTYLQAQLAPGTVITLDSMLRFLAFSSTQGNAVNQDVYGLGPLSEGTNDDIRYDSGGGFTNFYSATGQVIPEFSTAMQFGVLMLAGLAGGWRRRNVRAVDNA
jgi:hypothetical protein